MSRQKELVCLTKDPYIPGAGVTIIPQSKYFREEDITELFIDDPWWGTIDLTREDFVAATYAAYTVAAPPAWGVIMFNFLRTAFKCGSAPFWGGKVMGFVTPVGSRVLTT